MENALVIFLKNAVLGKVKTRLAATIGNEAALQVYEKLFQHTIKEVQQTAADKFLYFSDFINEEIALATTNFKQAVQHGNDLGERMYNAFKNNFDAKYKKVVIIGTDCPEVTTNICEAAFAALNIYDVVLGPAEDGGYYLIGLKAPHQILFTNIQWSTAHVLKDTITICQANNLSFFCLQTLIDIDEEKDLIKLAPLLQLHA
jgi:uncharacterized protein